MKINKLIFIFVFILFISCEESTLVDNSGEMTLENITNLPTLPSGFTYEAWLKVGGTAVSVGTFNISEETPETSFTFENIDVLDLNDANGFAVTVESTAGSSSISDFIILYGNFEGNSAQLNSNQFPAIGQISADQNITASFILRTPTTTITTDETKGIWFLDNSTGVDLASLNLNFGEAEGELQYQAWLQFIGNSGDVEYLNMGKFAEADITDDYNEFTTSEESVLDFPGEDFISIPAGLTIDLTEEDFPLDVRGKTVILQPTPAAYTSVETPFGLNFLSTEITSDAMAETNYSMNFITDFSATASR